MVTLLHPALLPAHSTPRRLAAAAVLSALAGLVHYLAAAEHLAEGVAPAAFMALVASAQLICAALLLRHQPSPWQAGAIVAGTLALFALYAVAYTTGLPVGSHPGMPEHLGPVVLVSKATELALVWTLAPFMASPGPSRSRSSLHRLWPALQQRRTSSPPLVLPRAA